MASLGNCLCDLCARETAEGSRCIGNKRRIWVRIEGPVDITNDPILYRFRYEGRIIIGHVFGEIPTVGNYYMARLVCATSEYAVYIPSTGVVTEPGNFWVLYQNQDIYQIVLPDTVTFKPAWLSEGLSAAYISLGIQQNSKVTLSVGTKIYYSADGAGSWSISLNSQGGLSLSKVKFDLNNQGIGFAVEDIPIFSSSDKNTLASSLSSVPETDYNPTNVHANYTSFYDDFMPITVYKTTDGGATWSTINLAYVGQIVPTRIGGSDYQTYHVESVTNGPCGWSPHDDICSWIDIPSIPSPVDYPCMSGSLTNITQAGSPRDITQRLSASWAVEMYGVCNTTGFSDASRLTFFGPGNGTPAIAPAHNGSGFYVLLPSTYRDVTYTDAGLNNTTQYISPFFDRRSNYNLTIHYVTIVINEMGSHWTIDSSSLSHSTERIYFGAEVDPTDSDRIYGLSNWWHVYLLHWSTQTITDVTPGTASSIANINDILVTDQGTVIIPIIYWTGSQYQYRVYRSDNQGGSWSYTNMTSQSGDVWNENLRIAQDSNETIGIMLQSGVIAYSGDDGLSWNFTSAIGEINKWVYEFEAS